MQNYIWSQIYKLGILFRNNLIFKNYDFLKISEKWSLADLEAYQLGKLKELVSFAGEFSPHYRAKFCRSGIDPQSINCLEDIKKLPILDKSSILEHALSIQVPGLKEKTFFSETSGSTGKPLIFYRNKDWDAWHNASVFRGCSWHGVEAWERNGYLWGYNISKSQSSKVRFFDFLQNRFRIFTYDQQEMSYFLKKLKKARYLSGYSSMIYELAKLANKNNLELQNIKMVKGTSEKIYDAYQDESLKAFGKKIISEYGSAEGGVIAFECPDGKMHVNMETVIVEEIENEIILTNLVSKSFPIIRYKLGDYIRLNKVDKCSCGMSHHIIEEVTGRVGSVIYGHNNKYPSLTLYYVFKNLALQDSIILNYHCVQKKKGYIELYIENDIDERTRGGLLREFKKYFHLDLNIKIYPNSERINFTSKKRDFVSYIS